MANNKFIIKVDPSSLVPKTSARYYYFGAMIVAALQAIVIALYWKSLPLVVPLYFTQPWGEARLASRNMLYLLPSLSLGLTIFNMSIGRVAREQRMILTNVLSVVSLAVSLMFGMALAGVLQSIL